MSLFRQIVASLGHTDVSVWTTQLLDILVVAYVF
jgi:hypothetical protein